MGSCSDDEKQPIQGEKQPECRVEEDCEEGLCLDGECVVEAECDSDDACGDGRCVDGVCESAGCVDDGDCLGGSCVDGACHSPSCEDGRKNGLETDVDCGGGTCPRCGEGLACAVADDCESRSCADGLCVPLVAPSCTVHHGGRTCGPNGDEDCCRSLPVTGFAKVGGKTVHLDKYEITAGRMRAFVEAIGSAKGGIPDVKGFMAAHRPERWNPAWEAVLPSGSGLGGDQPGLSYSISTPTPEEHAATSGPLYPGQDVNAALGGFWGNILDGVYTIHPGLVQTFGETHFFPEYENPDAGYHALNCSNDKGSYGFGTYFLPVDAIRALSGKPADQVPGKAFSREEMDERALNCTTLAMFAAFCAWDGGQLATDAVMEYVTAGRLGGAGDCADGVNSTMDAADACYMVWYQPSPSADSDDSGRIAPPGRVAADVVRITPEDEGWFDLKGNLVEAVLTSTDGFSTVGRGIGYYSISLHQTQIMTPRYKSGSLGARCMRLK